MGDLRAGYRFLSPALREAGYRVACTDPRGQGDSDATFPAYGDEETADDVAALIRELGAPVWRKPAGVSSGRMKNP
jgi:pimeloyl-ACP methyl ester carboxylesterase